ncbi:MAG: SGNH/GDSL hydrolase family protein [Clostridia bacterium]|nr:SGNH/GDSL hydrolase family protein [Clostridia bacterium]
MRILMLGNSFTYYHSMPEILAAMLDAEVVANTKGGAMLSEQLNPDTELGERALALLKDEKWDYVVLQEQSNAPITKKKSFMKSSAELCRIIKENGARPVFYASWAYREGTAKLATMNMSYDEMDERMLASYSEAAEENGALIAKVGTAFTAVRKNADLYENDDYHPSEAGSILAAATIARVIETDRIISP